MAKAPIIKELWMLWNTTEGTWILAIDDPIPYEAYLCATSFEAIEALQKHQLVNYDIESVPIRVR